MPPPSPRPPCGGSRGSLVTIGLIGFARSAPYGGGRAARAGAWVAVVGMALNVPAHGLSIALRDAKLDEPQVIVVLSLFGVGTLLTAIGMMLAGVGTIRAGMWSGWRRWVPLAVGLTAFALLALQVTPLLQEAVGLYSIALAALGVAVLVEGPRRSPAGEVSQPDTLVQPVRQDATNGGSHDTPDRNLARSSDRTPAPRAARTIRSVLRAGVVVFPARLDDGDRRTRLDGHLGGHRRRSPRARSRCRRPARMGGSATPCR